MKLQKELKTLIKEGGYRKSLILTLVHHSVSILGELEFDTTYRVTDTSRQSWELRRLFLKDGEACACLYPDNETTVETDLVVPANTLDTEDLLFALDGCLQRLGTQEIETRIKEKADEDAVAEIIKRHNLSSVDDLFLGENLKEGYQDEYNLLYSDLEDQYTKEIPYPGSVVCVECGGTDVYCDGTAQINTDRVTDWADSAFYDAVCEKCGWAVVTDSDRVMKDIESKLSEFKAEKHKEPNYAYCEIVHREKGIEGIPEPKKVWLKLSPRTKSDPDDSIHFYFQDKEEFLSFTRPVEGSEFVITVIEEFSDAL